ncbi:MAG: iron-containing alcohol dehydrogenase [Synergistes sp.]|nr:iron-containing alcohol dehydrogenase [Synergistes sp.]
MKNFVYCAPTKVVFGKDAESSTGALVREEKGSKVLLIYGGGSIKRSGLFDRITASLEEAGIKYFELGGVVPNPRLSLVYEGIEICRREGIDFLLSVGGGSVIDTAKAVAYGVPYDGDVWDFFCGKAVPESCMPMGCVLTISSAGSEMSNSCVITKEEEGGGLKRGYRNEISRQRFAVLNPELTYTLPPEQTKYGAVDIMMHTMERYFTTEKGLYVTDALAEGLMRTVMECMLILLDSPRDYDARANMMWASSLSHNGLTGCGSVEDWATHQIEHELSGMFDCPHAPGLSAVWGSWARYVMDADYSRFAQFAVNVMKAEPGADDRETAEKGIAALENFYRKIGMPTNIRELGIDLTDAQIAELAEKCTYFGKRTVGGFKKLGYEDLVKIYETARG